MSGNKSVCKTTSSLKHSRPLHITGLMETSTPQGLKCSPLGLHRPPHEYCSWILTHGFPHFHSPTATLQILNDSESLVFWISQGNISAGGDHNHQSSSTLLVTGGYVSRLPGWACSWRSILWACFYSPFKERISNVLISCISSFLLLWPNTKPQSSFIEEIIYPALGLQGESHHGWQVWQ